MVEDQKSLNIIGAGKLGKTLGYLLKDKLHIKNILNRSQFSANAARDFIGAGDALTHYADLTPADIYLIAVPDTQISLACLALVDTQILKPGDIVFHCSGLLSSDLLIPAQAAGASIASLHPNKSFAKPENSITDFAGTFCALEGDPAATDCLTKIFTALGAIIFPLEKENKEIYHAASTIASNYLVTLSSIAFSCYKKAGLSDEIAKSIANNLMQGTLENLMKLSHQQALTGAIQRGDQLTLSQHMQALACQPDIQKIYALLGLQTLALTTHDEEKKQQLANSML